MPVLEPPAPANRRKNFKPIANAHGPPPSPARKTLRQLEKEKASERNIDQVLFGEVLFKAWYPSWYPREILGEKSSTGETRGLLLPRLHVCARCFGYTRDLEEYVLHKSKCVKDVPGELVYIHPSKQKHNGEWTISVIDGAVDVVCLRLSQNFCRPSSLLWTNRPISFSRRTFRYLPNFSLTTNPSSSTCPPFSIIC